MFSFFHPLPYLCYKFVLFTSWIPYTTFHTFFQVRFLLPLLNLRWVAVLPQFQTPWTRLKPSLLALTSSRLTILILRTSRVLDLLMLTSMALEFLGSVLLTWRQSIGAVGTSCEDFFLAVPWKSISWSCWGVWWMTLSIMNDMEHNFIDTVSAKRILQWRAAIQELIRVGFAVELFLYYKI